MRKIISISFILIAVITMMAHSFIPHHEHDSTICFEKIECNDSDNNSEKEKHSCCLDKQDIIRSENKDEQDHSCSYDIMCDVHYPPIILFLGNFFELETYTSKSEYKPYINLYTSVEIYSTNSLRGPPQA